LVLFVGDGDEGLILGSCQGVRIDFNLGLDFIWGGRGRFCRPLKKFLEREEKKKKKSFRQGQKQSMPAKKKKKKNKKIIRKEETREIMYIN
jgi:hypothetical protein